EVLVARINAIASKPNAFSALVRVVPLDPKGCTPTHPGVVRIEQNRRGGDLLNRAQVRLRASFIAPQTVRRKGRLREPQSVFPSQPAQRPGAGWRKKAEPTTQA